MASHFWSELLVTSFRYQPQEDELQLHCEHQGRQLILTFRRVRQLRFECDVPMTHLVDFSIEDVSPDQLEGVQYSVRDESPGQLRFQCLEIAFSDLDEDAG
jgi:hypothetical protein